MTRMWKYLLLSTCWFFVACSNGEFVPKPKGYNFIELPEHTYQKSDSSGLYHFEYSAIAELKKDTTNWKREKSNYRILQYPRLGCKVHLTYKSIGNSPDTLRSLVDESYRLAYGHDKKASSIEDNVLVTRSGNVATVISIEGDVPSQYQFFTHDSTTHFMRGALYFDTALKNDSLAPVIEFIKADIHHLLNTLEWPKA